MFMEQAVVELVYKLDEKSTTNVCKCESTAKLPFKLVWEVTHIYDLLNGSA